jgi:hypothetical protein
MANGASLLLPGSNLTNLIVLAHEPFTGADFAGDMALPWLAVVVVTIGFVALAFRLGHAEGAPTPAPQLHLGVGAAATAAATALMLALHNAAIPVLAVGPEATASPAAADRPQPRAESALHRFALGLSLVPGCAGDWCAPVAQTVVPARSRARAADDGGGSWRACTHPAAGALAPASRHAARRRSR